MTITLLVFLARMLSVTLWSTSANLTNSWHCTRFHSLGLTPPIPLLWLLMHHPISFDCLVLSVWPQPSANIFSTITSFTCSHYLTSQLPKIQFTVSLTSHSPNPLTRIGQIHTTKTPEGRFPHRTEHGFPLHRIWPCPLQRLHSLPRPHLRCLCRLCHLHATYIPRPSHTSPAAAPLRPHVILFLTSEGGLAPPTDDPVNHEGSFPKHDPLPSASEGAAILSEGAAIPSEGAVLPSKGAPLPSEGVLLPSEGVDSPATHDPATSIPHPLCRTPLKSDFFHLRVPPRATVPDDAPSSSRTRNFGWTITSAWATSPGLNSKCSPTVRSSLLVSAPLTTSLAPVASMAKPSAKPSASKVPNRLPSNQPKPQAILSRSTNLSPPVTASFHNGKASSQNNATPAPPSLLKQGINLTIVINIVV